MLSIGNHQLGGKMQKNIGLEKKGHIPLLLDLLHQERVGDVGFVLPLNLFSIRLTVCLVRFQIRSDLIV